MGFFGRLFGGKKQDKSGAAKARRKWSFTARSSNPSKRCADEEESLDGEKHAIAVAAATAAVAEAALAAAHAAAEVVRLTSGTVGRGGDRASSSLTQIGWSKRRWSKEYVAAMKIQSAFRGYLARRALRALKALVKLQALVRGHIVRKQTADMLRRMQTLVRLQARARARARASRSSHVSDSFHSSSSFIPSSSPHSLHARCVSDADFREVVAMDHQRHHHSLYNEEDDTNDDKILQVDTWKPHYHSRTLRSDHHHHQESPRKRQSLVVPTSVENSPQVGSRPGSSSGSRRKTPSPFTPTRSEYSGNSYYSGYHPNYMANTESYRAKVRSHSAPRQRLQEFSSESGYQRSLQGHYYYYTAAAERSFDQRSDTDRLSRNQSERSKMYSSFLNPASLLF